MPSYYIDIFSPETYMAFSASDKTIAGFTPNKKNQAATVRRGDRFVCYVTKVSRWVGVLEVQNGPFTDDTPRFTDASDQYTLRFNVKAIAWLSLEQAIPMTEDLVWRQLSFTQQLPKDSIRWTIYVRSSLRKLDAKDGTLLEHLLDTQQRNGLFFPLDDQDQKKLRAPRVKTTNNRQLTVSIPENEDQVPTSSEPAAIELSGSQRESFRIQALLAQIGERMKMKVWLPRSDKKRVLDYWQAQSDSVLEHLPLNYDDATLKTIENIDVLWIRGRSIVRAFEVEHTTSIYSGILRMADLMALQPNLNIKAHIVAPLERRDKVFEELTRPVFTYLEKGPLRESCTFLSYDAVAELSAERRLEYMTDDVLDEYTEDAEESGK